MAKPTGFVDYPRAEVGHRPIEERIGDWQQTDLPMAAPILREQAARCMDCGVPFCHSGCPLGNIIPDWNDLVYLNRWRRAIEMLHATNNFPEFTGRICPAPCEEACVLGINEPPVTIEQIERTIVERAFEAGWIKPQPPERRTGKSVAVVGSGPAGLACAQQLNRAGHHVTVLERDDRIGGLLRYGIPDFKLEKWVVERRLELMEQEGVVFRTNVHVGTDYPADRLRSFDAVVLCGGATKPRDLPMPGRDLDGVHFAMEYLTQQNRLVAGDRLPERDSPPITAEGKHVIVIGGGDTGSDCIGTANRQKAKSVTQFEILPTPPDDRPPHQPWPFWPVKLRTSTSHEEGCQQYWSIATTEFLGDGGRVQRIRTIDVEFEAANNGGQPRMKQVAGSEREWPADLVLLAMGFLGPETDGMIGQLGVELDPRGSVKTDESYMTSVPGIFAAGDMRRGQSLVVWAISEGREAARGVDRYLTGHTELPTKGDGDLPRL